MNYKIVNGKVGFPTNSLGKVTSKLDDCKVNYIVIVNDIEEDKKYLVEIIMISIMI